MDRAAASYVYCGPAISYAKRYAAPERFAPARRDSCLYAGDVGHFRAYPHHPDTGTQIYAGDYGNDGLLDPS